jgi:tRNA threonylcarbamoyladenosine biosynthesis protein TsaB
MIFFIDTSEKITKLALYKDGFSKVSEKNCTLNSELSERLLSEIDQLLKQSGCDRISLSKIFVAEGPGSYTGLRIGVTTANFLAFSLDIPVFKYNLNEKNSEMKKRALDVDKFITPVLPYYKTPPHITKPVLPS